MNENYTGDNSPTTDTESVNINELVSRVEELEQRVDDQQSTIDDQQSTIESQQETIEDQQETIEDAQNEIDELRSELIEHQERSVRKIAETMKDVNQLQESLESDSSDTTPAPTDGGTTIQEHDLKPIEQICRADSENLDEVMDSPSVRRALSLVQNMMAW